MKTLLVALPVALCVPPVWAGESLPGAARPLYALQTTDVILDMLRAPEGLRRDGTEALLGLKTLQERLEKAELYRVRQRMANGIQIAAEAFRGRGQARDEAGIDWDCPAHRSWNVKACEVLARHGPDFLRISGVKRVYVWPARINGRSVLYVNVEFDSRDAFQQARAAAKTPLVIEGEPILYVYPQDDFDDPHEYYGPPPDTIVD